MKCPACPDTTLLMSERQGVEIDYCPNCRGVWLDRGELDKLIQLGIQQQAASEPARTAPAAVPAPRQGDGYYQERGYPDKSYQERDKYQNKHYRKKSWLHEIFD